MTGLTAMPHRIASDWMFMHSIRHHRSQLGWRDAPRYSKHWEHCRKTGVMQVRDDSAIKAAAERFSRDGVTELWTPESGNVARAIADQLKAREAEGETLWLDNPAQTGSNRYAGNFWLDFPELEALFRNTLGDFLALYFGSSFKIWFALLYRSQLQNDRPTGSQRWHSDSGPGSCVNVMFYIQDMEQVHGPLAALPWPQCLEVLAGERAAVSDSAADERDPFGRLYDYCEKEITDHFSSRVVRPTGPAGLIVPFLNSTIHRGGYPEAGHAHTAIVFHCYPFDGATPFERYREIGVEKRGSYPTDPAENF
jgi:hypothetical protein